MPSWSVILSWLDFTLCDVKRDLAVPLRRDISIAHAFISSGEETTDLFCLLSARTSSDMQLALFQESFVLTLQCI